MPTRLRRLCNWLLALSLSCLAGAAHSQTSEIFKGKTVTVYVSYPPGGGYDLYARVLARHMGRFLPGNPNLVVSNMPATQGLACANFMFGAAPGDGTAIAILNQSIAEYQLLGVTGARFDVSKYSWIGRITSNIEIIYVWHTVPVDTIEDLRHRETIFGANGATIPLYAQALNAAAGTRFKVIRGYPGTRETHFALERGEVEAALSSMTTLRTTKADWLSEKKIKTILQFSLQRGRELPDIPAIVELGKTSEDKDFLSFFASGGTIGRSFVAPPYLPAYELSILRAAFDATMQDSRFLADIAQSKLDLSPLTGAELQKIAARSVEIEPGHLERIRAMWMRQ